MFLVMRFLNYDDGIFVLLENGELPKIEIAGDLEKTALLKIDSLLIGDPSQIWLSKSFSSISSSEIHFNFWCPNKKAKSGIFVPYNEKSIELQRYINHRKI